MSGDEEGGEAALASGGPERQRRVSLPGPAVAQRDDVLATSDYSQRASSSTSILLRLGMAAKSKVSKLLTAGNLASRMRRSTTRRSRSRSSSSTRRSR
jgi:hypothetical protein